MKNFQVFLLALFDKNNLSNLGWFQNWQISYLYFVIQFSYLVEKRWTLAESSVADRKLYNSVSKAHKTITYMYIGNVKLFSHATLYDINSMTYPITLYPRAFPSISNTQNISVWRIQILKTALLWTSFINLLGFLYILLLVFLFVFTFFLHFWSLFLFVVFIYRVKC